MPDQGTFTKAQLQELVKAQFTVRFVPREVAMSTINYAAATADLDPEASFSTMIDPFVYETLTWRTPSIEKAVLEAHWLQMEKNRQVSLVSAAMHADTTGGFPSDTLVPGVFQIYDSDLQGQIAVVGAMVYLTPVDGVTPPPTFTLSSLDPATGQRGYASHSYAQLYKLFTDLGAFANSKIVILEGKINTIFSTNSGNVTADLDTIHAINWP